MIVDAYPILENDFIKNAMPALEDGHCITLQGRIFTIKRNYTFLTKQMRMKDVHWQELSMTSRTVFGDIYYIPTLPRVKLFESGS